MGEVSTIDARMQAALARLTANEKECLRRRLQQQTAKEMALELGVSPHAVEKRLKMARAKLGLSSSLEAARLLVATEGYQQPGPQASDLDDPVHFGNPRAGRWRTLGVVTMGILATILLAYAAQTGGGAEPAQLSDESGSAPEAQQFISASASPAQVEEHVKEQFARFDRDGSGFIERLEGPASISSSCCGAPAKDDAAGDDKILTGDAAWRRFLSDNADDGDNRVSFAEFRGARYETLLRDGIPVRREDVRIVGERPSPYREAQPGEAPVQASAEDLEYVQASPERVRAFVRQMFDNWDVDKSGFVELPEAPVVLITQPARLDEEGKAIMDVNAPAKQLEGDAARRQYIAHVDKDGDGKVSFDEYAEPVMPQFLRRGIPLIPADWKPVPPGRE